MECPVCETDYTPDQMVNVKDIDDLEPEWFAVCFGCYEGAPLNIQAELDLN